MLRHPLLMPVDRWRCQSNDGVFISPTGCSTPITSNGTASDHRHLAAPNRMRYVAACPRTDGTSDCASTRQERSCLHGLKRFWMPSEVLTPKPVKKSRNTTATDYLAVGKVFQDPVHGQIELPVACTEVIDTPEFQRLRSLKQLGAWSAFPSATHTRFEHSLGVAHLAWVFLKELKAKHREPELPITPKKELCVVLAALCHDIGHGPFSHLFETVMPKLDHEHELDNEHEYKHEHISLKLIDKIFTRIGFENVGLDNKSDLEMIKAMIDGNPPDDVHPDERYLYDIVSNRENGLDVDKLDYFMRDSYHTGVRPGVSFGRLLKNARVHRCKPTSKKERDIESPVPAGVDAEWESDTENDAKKNEESDHASEKMLSVRAKKDPLRISFPAKTLAQVLDVFKTRFFLHQTIYHHPASKAVEFMICDALVAARDELTRQVGEKIYKLADSVKEMDAFIQFTDSVLEEILRLQKDHPARKIVERIQKRKLYKLVGHLVVVDEERLTPPSDGEESGKKEKKKFDAAYLKRKITEDILAAMRSFTSHDKNEIWKKDSGEKVAFEEDDFVVDILTMHHGMGNKNPVESVYFFFKTIDANNIEQPAKHVNCSSYSAVWPSKYREVRIRVYAKNTDVLLPSLTLLT
ncbi:MAG: hypothetical protein MHM6MM_004456 [Cercozoa sp. M6MM]